jgi:uncharacterized membrane protein YeaQ/YmgE (transglycosylase-associated protein family)
VLILALLGLGMLIGWIAQAILGMGTRPNAQSLIAGVLGSFLGGLVVSLIAGDGIKIRPSGIIGSIIGAIVVLLIWQAIDRSKRKKAAEMKKSSRSGDPRKRAHPGAH